LYNVPTHEPGGDLISHVKTKTKCTIAKLRNRNCQIDKNEKCKNSVNFKDLYILKMVTRGVLYGQLSTTKTHPQRKGQTSII
jgi:hypothetical protein